MLKITVFFFNLWDTKEFIFSKIKFSDLFEQFFERKLCYGLVYKKDVSDLQTNLFFVFSSLWTPREEFIFLANISCPTFTDDVVEKNQLTC